MSGSIPISEETLNSFHQDYETDHSEVGGESPDATKQLNEAVNWLLKTADSALRKKDERLGTDGESLARISELSVLVAKRNLSEDVLKNSPELFLGTILTGLAIEKSIVLKQIQSEQNEGKSQPQTEDSEDNEQ